MQLGHRAVEGFIAGADDLELGQQHQPLRADLNAGAVPGEEGDSPALFQVGNHPADSGLGVAQLGGGLGDAAGFNGLEVGDVLLNAHKDRLPSLICISHKNSFQKGMFHRKNSVLYILPNDYIIVAGKFQHNLYRSFEKIRKKSGNSCGSRFLQHKRVPKHPRKMRVKYSRR